MASPHFRETDPNVEMQVLTVRRASAEMEVQPQHPGRKGLLTLVIPLVAMVASYAAGGELSHFALAGLQMLPFLILAGLGWLAPLYPVARVLAWLWLGVVLLGIAGFSLATANMALQAAVHAEAPKALSVASAHLLLVLTGVLLAVLGISVLGTLTPISRWVAAYIPIDGSHFHHAAALATLTMLTLAPAATLVVLNGHPPLLLSADAWAPSAETGRAATGPLIGFAYGLIWMLLTAFVAAGFPVRRTFTMARVRLGLIRPTLRQVAAAVVTAVGLLLCAHLLEIWVANVWTALAWPRTDVSAFHRILGSAMSPIGALVVGVTAGLGEEVIVRGLLQPRVGWLLANLAFTATHAYQYGGDGLVSVFLIGAVIALVRARTNTTTAALAHGGYNTLVILTAALLTSAT